MVESAFVLLHERKAAPLQGGRKALHRNLEIAKRDDLAEATFQVAEQGLVAQEQHVGVVAMFPPALDVLEPGAKLHFPLQELIEELLEAPLVAVVAPVE